MIRSAWRFRSSCLSLNLSFHDWFDVVVEEAGLSSSEGQVALPAFADLLLGGMLLCTLNDTGVGYKCQVHREEMTEEEEQEWKVKDSYLIQMINNFWRANAASPRKIGVNVSGLYILRVST